jgi:RHS repeat-associated protein
LKFLKVNTMLTHFNRHLSRLAAAGIAFLTLSVGLTATAHAAQSVTLTSAEPAQILIARSSIVRFSAEISDPSLITTSVNLLRVGLPNTNPTIVGVLHDDGLNGDAIAGDGRYSIEVTLNEPAAKKVVYRISAAFKGRLLRVTSTDIAVDVLANRPPVAMAGRNQAVSAGSDVTLDGRQSFDLDGDLISFAWVLTSVPSGSNASLNSAILVKPVFTADVAGTYVASLIVNDGSVNSVVSAVTIQAYAGNTPPRAVIGGNLMLPFGVGPTAVAALSGASSVDPEGSPLGYVWRIVNKPVLSTTAIMQPLNDSNTMLTVDKLGSYVVELIVNDGSLVSAPMQATVTFYTPNTPPSVNAGADQAVIPGTLVHLSGLTTDIDAGDGIAVLGWTFISRPLGSGATLQNFSTNTPTFVADVVGDYLLELVATDSHGALSRSRVLVRASGLSDGDGDGVPDTLDRCPATPPNTRVDANGCSVSQLSPVTLSLFAASPVSGFVPLSVDFKSQASGGTGNFSFNWAFGDGQTSTLSNLTHIYSVAGNYNAGVTVIDGLGTTASASAAVVVSPIPPRDPSPTNPPPIDQTVSTSTFASTAFLYTGANPVQTGVVPGTIDARRVMVLRGKVEARDGSPIPAVQISVLGHPEFGQTLTRDDGAFDLAVNGGGQLTLRYVKDGFLAVQRAIVTSWRDYAWLPDVVMIPLDSAVTAVNLGSTTVQVARGSPVSDADGARRATILFPPGTGATMVLPDGTTRPLTTLNVRATEYTVGASGPMAMPAALPPSSGYTYAVELSVDEAVAAGATEVRFSQALPIYVENFIGFPVGGAVPSGYYDQQKGQWIASANGRVIKVLGITSNLADIDTDGDDLADDATKLATLGITAEEQARLAQLYTIGQTLWRVPITHFTPWDFNWPFGLPSDVIPPPSPVNPAMPIDKPSDQCGSVIGCENQTLGESLPVTGTPWELHYRSQRTPGLKDAYTLDIPVSGTTIPASLRAIRVEVSIAGHLYKQNFAPAPNLNYTVTWDGKDGYGRPLQGLQPASVQVHYDYVPQRYSARSDFGNSFAKTEAAGVPVSVSRSAGMITISSTSIKNVGVRDTRMLGFGGWSLAIQHSYDPVSRTLFLGDGQQRSAEAIRPIITTVAGNGVGGFSGDSVPAVATALYHPIDVTLRADGTLFIADFYNNRVRQVGPDGIITTVAGNGVQGFSGDGGPAVAAALNRPIGVAVGADGSLFIAEYLNNRVRRVGPDGIITTFAGNGAQSFSGDGGPAVAAALNHPVGVTVGADGSLFIAEYFNNRVRRVGPDGIITTFAGNGVAGFSGDGGPAVAAALNGPTIVPVGPDGSLFIADSYNNRVRRVGPDGIITTVAGNGVAGVSGDGGLAVAAALNYPRSVAIGADGSLLIAQYSNNRVRRVGPDGIITTLAGNGGANFAGDGGSAVAAALDGPTGMAIGADGSLYIADHLNHRIRRVAPVMQNFSTSDNLVPSQDGSEVYIFNNSGRHLKTQDALTGALRAQFGYDTFGYLTSITDGSGNVTVIERTGATPTSIVAPGGQRTMLSANSDGWLNSGSNPANEAHTMSYSTDGLLLTFTNPNGNIHRFTYDVLGRLIKDEDPVGGSTTLSRTEQSNGYTVITTSALGRSRVYQVEQLLTGEMRRTRTDSSGAKTVTLTGTDGSEQTTSPDGDITTTKYGPDPRWGMLSPVASSVIVKTPAGLTRTITATRTATLANPNDLFSLTNLTDTVTDNGAISTRVYNGTLRLLTSTSAIGRTSTANLDAQGRVTQQQIAGIEPVTYTYDSRGLLSNITEGSGATIRTANFVHNAAGDLTSASDALGQTGYIAYDSVGRVVTQTLPDSSITQYSYDAAGNVIAITPPGRSAHDFAYTPIDQISSYTPPNLGSDSTATQYSYNVDRAPTHITRPDGNIVDIAYDTGGRTSSLGIARGLFNYSYNATTSQLTGVTAPGGLGLNYSYDGALPTGVTWSGAVTGATTYTYNNLLLASTESINAANSVNFTYDVDGLLKTAGNLALTRSAQNGLLTGSTLGGATDSMTYNTLAELTNYSASYTTTGIYSAAYSHDALGRITQKVETIGGTPVTYGYSYDSAGRLIAVTKDTNPLSTYSYDSNGNRTASTGLNGPLSASYDAQDRLTSYGSNTYSYTANGELLSKTVGTQTTSYQYDAIGNLLNVTLPDGTAIDYLIDGENRRIGKKMNGTLVQAFLYQGRLRPVAELNGANTIVSRFVYATHINVPDYMIKAGVTYRIITDNLGSPRLVVNASTGAVVQRMDYDEFGNVIADSNPGFQPFGFAGGLYDRNTKLVRFGARDYDAEVGRWTAKDPILFEGGDRNLYAYVEGNPLSYTDPEGLQAFNGQTPPGNIPGGPWTPQPGQPPGVYQGPANPNGGPRDVCRYVPDEANGGPKGAQEGYWKTKTPTTPWTRFDSNGNPISPGQAHPGNPPAAPPPIRLPIPLLLCPLCNFILPPVGGVPNA